MVELAKLLFYVYISHLNLGLFIMIHIIVFIIIVIQLYLTCKNKVSSLIFYVSTLMLLPNVVKYQIGGLGVVYSYFTGLCMLPLLLRKVPQEYKSYLRLLYFLMAYQFLLLFITGIPFSLQLKNLILSFFTCYILYLLPLVSIDTAMSLGRVNKVLYFVILIVSLYGLLTFIMGQNPYFQYLRSIYPQSLDASSFMEDSRGVVSSRVFSTMAHPLCLGQILTLFFFYFRNIPSVLKNKAIYKVGLYVILLTALLSGSRAVFFSIIVFYAFDLLSISNLKTELRTLISLITFVLIIILMVGGPALSELLAAYFGSLSFDLDAGNMGGSSGSLRLFQLFRSFDIVNNNLFLGMGIGFVHEFGDKYPEMLGYESIIFKKLIDEGLIGLFLYILFFIFLLKLGRRTVKAKDFSRWSFCFMTSYIVSIVFTGDQQSSGYFFLLFLLMIKYYRLNNYGCICYNSKL